MNKKHVILAGILIILFGVSISLKSSRKKIKSTENDDVTITKQKLKTRRPSSISKEVIVRQEEKKKEEGPAFSVSERQQFLDQKLFMTTEEEEKQVHGINANERTPFGVSNQSATGSRQASYSSKSAPVPAKSSFPTNGPLQFSNVLPPGSPSIDPSKPNSGPTTTPTSSVPPSSQKPDDDTPPSICHANIGGGSFSAPVSVELSCSNTSSVKYCLSEGTCCDPETGPTYSGPITIGQAAKTFCLSYTGGGDVTEATYSFDVNLPHLDVVQKKLQIQTTQLDEQLVLASNNFGSNDHSIGLVNFKKTNPQALNLTCQEAVEYVPSGWAGSGNLVILPETPVAPYSAMDQINVLINLSKLVYGNNYLVSYVKGQQYAEEQFACVHSNLILNDFFYFQNLPIEAETTNDFIGGFTAIGPSEDNTLIYRGPASDQSSDSSEELRSGLVSIFFDK